MNALAFFLGVCLAVIGVFGMVGIIIASFCKDANKRINDEYDQDKHNLPPS